MSQDCDVDREVQLEHQAGIESVGSLLSFKFENECLIKVEFATSSHMLSVVPAFQKADRNRNVLVVSWVHEVDKSSSACDVARQVPLVWVKSFNVLRGARNSLVLR